MSKREQGRGEIREKEKMETRKMKTSKLKEKVEEWTVNKNKSIEKILTYVNFHLH